MDSATVLVTVEGKDGEGDKSDGSSLRGIGRLVLRATGGVARSVSLGNRTKKASATETSEPGSLRVPTIKQASSNGSLRRKTGSLRESIVARKGSIAGLFAKAGGGGGGSGAASDAGTDSDGQQQSQEQTQTKSIPSPLLKTYDGGASDGARPMTSSSKLGWRGSKRVTSSKAVRRVSSLMDELKKAADKDGDTDKVRQVSSPMDGLRKAADKDGGTDKDGNAGKAEAASNGKANVGKTDDS